VCACVCVCLCVCKAGDVYKPRDDRRCVFHYHYTAWPDKGLPSDPKVLVEFLCLVLNKQASFRDAGPVVVHCRSTTTVQLSLSLSVTANCSLPVLISLQYCHYSAEPVFTLFTRCFDAVGEVLGMAFSVYNSSAEI